MLSLQQRQPHHHRLLLRLQGRQSQLSLAHSPFVQADHPLRSQYCKATECQRSDWDTLHKRHCKAFAAIRKDRQTNARNRVIRREWINFSLSHSIRAEIVMSAPHGVVAEMDELKRLIPSRYAGLVSNLLVSSETRCSVCLRLGDETENGALVEGCTDCGIVKWCGKECRRVSTHRQPGFGRGTGGAATPSGETEVRPITLTPFPCSCRINFSNSAPTYKP